MQLFMKSIYCQFGICRDECSLITDCHRCSDWEDKPCPPSPDVFDGDHRVHSQSLANSNFIEGKPFI